MSISNIVKNNLNSERIHNPNAYNEINKTQQIHSTAQIKTIQLVITEPKPGPPNIENIYRTFTTMTDRIILGKIHSWNYIAVFDLTMYTNAQSAIR